MELVKKQVYERPINRINDYAWNNIERAAWDAAFLNIWLQVDAATTETTGGE